MTDTDQFKKSVASFLSLGPNPIDLLNSLVMGANDTTVGGTLPAPIDSNSASRSCISSDDDDDIVVINEDITDEGTFFVVERESSPIAEETSGENTLSQEQEKQGCKYSDRTEVIIDGTEDIDDSFTIIEKSVVEMDTDRTTKKFLNIMMETYFPSG